MKRQLWVYSIIFIFLGPCLLHSAGLPPGKVTWPSFDNLEAEVFSNGDVEIHYNHLLVGRVYLEMFTGIWQGYWPHEFKFTESDEDHKKLGFAGTSSVEGAEVDVKSRIDQTPNGLRVRWSVINQNDIRMSNVSARIGMPFNDWQGMPYQLNGKNGKVVDRIHDFLSADTLKVLMGPCEMLSGFSYEVNTAGVNGGIYDERVWHKPRLIVTFLHNESFPQTWVWEKGTIKNFDFTITFFQKPDPTKTVSVTPTPLTALTATPTVKLQPTATKTSTLVMVAVIPPWPTAAAFLRTFPTRAPQPVIRYTPVSQKTKLVLRVTPRWSVTPTLSIAKPRKRKPKPNLTPTVTATDTSTPTVRVKIHKKTIHLTPTPTARIVIKAKTPNAISSAAPVMSTGPDLGAPQTILYSVPPANIYLTPSDGPGHYRLEVLDEKGNHLKTVFDQQVVAAEGIWVEWGGDDEDGKIVPVGTYMAQLSKDGKLLKRMVIIRTPDSP